MGHSLCFELNERIQRLYPRAGEVSGIARNNNEIMHKRGCRNLLIDRIFRIGHAKTAPDLCDKTIELQNFSAVTVQKLV